MAHPPLVTPSRQRDTVQVAVHSLLGKGIDGSVRTGRDEWLIDHSYPWYGSQLIGFEPMSGQIGESLAASQRKLEGLVLFFTPRLVGPVRFPGQKRNVEEFPVWRPVEPAPFTKPYWCSPSRG